MTFRTCCAVMLVALATSSALLAHHSTAAYDTKTVTLTNAIVKHVVWANPHSVI